MSCNEYRNRKTLIAGEVNSGKTEWTFKILRELMGCEGGPIAVLDLAPERIQGVGGKMLLSPAEKEKVLYFSPLILPPRLTGKTAGEILALAWENCQRIEETLRALRERTFWALVINDVSLYLQGGEVESLMASVKGISTLVMNGYYGRYFGESAFSRREREQMEALMLRCDKVFHLPPVPHPSP